MKKKAPKKIIIIGATSGIGFELARLYVSRGDIVGCTGRRAEKLQAIREEFPANIHCRVMDVRSEACTEQLDELIGQMGGMDMLIYCAGVGNQNPSLQPDIETDTVFTNVVGFSRIVIHAYNYFKQTGSPAQIVDISSLAGMRSMRQSPAYSATKRYQMHYMSCLAQKANKEKQKLTFTTIIPGFIRTDIIKHDYPFVTNLKRGTKLIFNAIEHKKRMAIVPGHWRGIALIWRLIPNAIWEKIW